MKTTFSKVYDCFYSKITDDMYMELDEAQTAALTEELLIGALPSFEFPRQNVHSYDLDNKSFNVELTQEEINIIATYMVIGWLGQQIASVEVIRMKFSGSDFKFTSQANHIAKLLSLKKEYEKTGHHLQRLYKRRISNANGIMQSTLSRIMPQSVRHGEFVDITPAGGGSSGGGSTPSSPDEWEDMD